MTQSIIGCLVKGTLVRMADGSTKAIETVQAGDDVIGVDATDTGFQYRPVRVTRVFDHGPQSCRTYRFSTTSETDDRRVETTYKLTCTTDHKVLTVAAGLYTQVPVGQLNHTVHRIPVCPDTATMLLSGLRADGTPKLFQNKYEVAVAGPPSAPEELLPTYDIEVDCPSHLFVLSNGLIVSNSKHGGGVAGSSKSQQGFPVLDRLISIPQSFPGGAVHAQNDGLVTAVTPAPQGGHYVTVGGHDHFVDPDLEVKAQPGTTVEAGDVLTDGIERPDEYTAHKGIGEARKRFVDTFQKASVAAGFRPHRRNLELVARGLIDHVRLTKEPSPDSPYVAGDVVPYSALENEYEPREGHEETEPKYAVGKYLERPVLHHSIGTRVKPSMLPLFEKHGVKSLTVHAEPPPWVSEMQRSHDSLSFDDDWMTKILGTGLEKNLLKDVHRGAISDPSGTSFVPALAEGVNFGKPGNKTTGWKLPGS